MNATAASFATHDHSQKLVDEGQDAPTHLVLREFASMRDRIEPGQLVRVPPPSFHPVAESEIRDSKSLTSGLRFQSPDAQIFPVSQRGSTGLAPRLPRTLLLDSANLERLEAVE